MFAAQFFKFDKPRRLATSGGLGTMGYGLPASMGACLAYPDRLVVNIDGDGSMLMNIQELATIHVERLPVKCIILNNQHLGMVVQWEDLKYDSNRAQTFLADPHDNYDPTHKTKKQYPFSYEDRKGYIAPQAVIEELYRQTADKDPIICTGVGQHQMFAAQFFKFDKPRRLATSGGLGTMGYGLPASMGACLAYPDRLVVNIDGDGSMLMNIQELATIHVERLPVKCIILNNQHLGMVVQWEDLKYDSNRAQTFLADPHDNYDPTHKTEDVIYPNYPLICAGFGVKCERVLRIEELPAAITRMIESPEAYVLDVMVPHDVHVLPMILGGMSYKDVILERIAGDGSAKKASELGKEIPTAL